MRADVIRVMMEASRALAKPRVAGAAADRPGVPRAGGAAARAPRANAARSILLVSKVVLFNCPAAAGRSAPFVWESAARALA